VTGRLSFGPSPLAEKLLAAAERDERPLIDAGLEQFRPIFAFDPFVYRCLRDGIPAGRICRGCGCSWNDACMLSHGPCAWEAPRGDGEDRCTRCTGTVAEDGTRTSLLARIPLGGEAPEAMGDLVDFVGDRLRATARDFHGLHALEVADGADDMRELAIEILEHARPGLPHTRTIRFVAADEADLGGVL
jgi:hypothetical protein